MKTNLQEAVIKTLAIMDAVNKASNVFSDIADNPIGEVNVYWMTDNALRIDIKCVNPSASLRACIDDLAFK